MRIQRTSQVITVTNLLSMAFTVLPLPQPVNAQPTNASPELAPPEFLANKTPQPDLLLKDKREGRYLTGFPAIGWGAESKFTPAKVPCSTWSWGINSEAT